MRVLAIDLGGTLTKYCLMNENAEISARGEIDSPVIGVESWVNAIAGLYNRFRADIEGVTLSLPGMLNPETGFMRSSGAFIDLKDQNVMDLLRPHIDKPLCIENDGKCGALSEVWRGALKDVRDGAVVIIGTGLAGGLIKDRRLHRGAHFSAGEISYLMARPGEYGFQNFICMQGGMLGLMSGVARAKGIDPARMQKTRALKYAGGAQKDTQPPPEARIDGQTVFEWIAQGDPDVVPVYTRFIQALAMLIFNLQVVYDPELIAVGGGVSRQARLLPDIQAELERITGGVTITAMPKAVITPCHFLSDANLVGAMYNYLTRFHPDLAG